MSQLCTRCLKVWFTFKSVSERTIQTVTKQKLYKSNNQFAKHFSSSSSSSASSQLKSVLYGIPPSSYVMLLIPGFTFYLGIWQIQRRKWKLNLLKELGEKSRKAGVPIPDDLDEMTSDKQYVKYILRGEFDHSKETCIGPRTKIGDDAGGGLISSSSSVGVHIVTPFKLADRDVTVLVNRGWLPMRQKDVAERDADRIKGEVTIGAVFRKSDSSQATPFVSRELYSERSRMWMKRDVPAIAATLGCEPLFFDADEQSSVSGGPVGGQTVVQLRNEHLSYIFTWFALTALMLGIWYFRFIRSPRRDTVHQLMRSKQR